MNLYERAAEIVSERYEKEFTTKDGVPPTIRIKKTEGLYGGKKVQFDFDVNEAGTYYYYIRKDSSAAAPTVDDVIKTHTGKDKGSEGKVIRVEDDKLLVEGINMVTKHQKANQANPNGGIVKVEALIDASNVMLVYKGKPTRVGFKMDGDKKVRVAKSTGDVID